MRWALVLGIGAGVVAWWQMPHWPRTKLTLPEGESIKTLSPDCTLLISQRDPKTFRGLWDLQTKQRVHVFASDDGPYPPDPRIPVHYYHFVETQTILEARLMPEGEKFRHWKLDELGKCHMVKEWYIPFRGHTVRGTDGRFYFLGRDFPKTTLFSIEDARFLNSFDCEHESSGGRRIPGALVMCGQEMTTVIAVPSFEKLIQVPTLRVRSNPNCDEFALSRDGKTLVRIAYWADVWKLPSKSYKRVEIPGSFEPNLSSDGRFLVSSTFGGGVIRPRSLWKRITQWFGVSSPNDGVARVYVHDLDSGAELGVWRDMRKGQFSQDERTLAVMSDNTVLLYDFPLERPWLRVLFVAVIAACVPFLFRGLGAVRRRLFSSKPKANAFVR
ncbi:MAG: hypothetical protein L0Y70_19865 [Gemmataceae bacterium]|nr:hypothetical protein [Gemmataceae bacterium]